MPNDLLLMLVLLLLLLRENSNVLELSELVEIGRRFESGSVFFVRRLEEVPERLQVGARRRHREQERGGRGRGSSEERRLVHQFGRLRLSFWRHVTSQKKVKSWKWVKLMLKLYRLCLKLNKVFSQVLAKTSKETDSTTENWKKIWWKRSSL